MVAETPGKPDLSSVVLAPCGGREGPFTEEILTDSSWGTK